MIPASSGIAHGAVTGGAKVILAGGTQMCAVLEVLKILGTPLDNICIATTSYVLNDNSSDIKGLVESIAENVPILSIDLDFKSSSIHGLKMYCHGIAKEGVGAGGAAIASILKDGLSNDNFALLKVIENEYEKAIAAKRIIS
jgi:NaMN:DMB phosphoribosyltransferase